MENEEKVVKVEWRSVFTLQEMEEAEIWELDENEESDEQRIVKIGKIHDP